MDTIFTQLGSLLLQAIPTALILIFLHFFLSNIFFKPLKKVMDERYDRTEGASKRAQEVLVEVKKKTAEYEGAIHAARTEIYKQQESFHARLQADFDEAINSAREDAKAQVREAQSGIENERKQAREVFDRQAPQLAETIAQAILKGRAS
jgi:F0F1-type ATP synthase membrane subunit b/b'